MNRKLFSFLESFHADFAVCFSFLEIKKFRKNFPEDKMCLLENPCFATVFRFIPVNFLISVKRHEEIVNSLDLIPVLPIFAEG